MLELEKYKGSGSRRTCPACGRAKKFTQYIDTDTGRYIAQQVGRCDRETSCGYHYTPKQYFADNPGINFGTSFSHHFAPNWALQNLQKPAIENLIKPKVENFAKPDIYTIRTTGPKHENGLERNYEGHFQTKSPDYIESAFLVRTLTNYGRNSFVRFLLRLFANDHESVNQAVKDYLIGTKDGFTVFPAISKVGKVCKAKLMKFNSATGKRLKEDYSISSLQSKLKNAGDLKEDFETDKDVFFGEHLLVKYEGLPIAIVEAEKSAVIGSICKGVFPDMVWLATGSKQWLKVDRLKRLGRSRTIVLYPDADGFEKWQSIASEARKHGLKAILSELIEKNATDAEKAKGYDLADYLIREQARRNDPANREAFRELIEERLAIMIIDGGLSQEQAEAELETSPYYHNAIRSVQNGLHEE